MRDTMQWTYFERMANIEERFYQQWQAMALNDSMTSLERSRLSVWEYPLGSKYTKIWQQIQAAPIPGTLAEAVQMVRNSTVSSGFAWLGDAADIQYLVMQHCDLRVVGEEFSRQPYAIAVQQGSPLKELFDREILRLLSSRRLEKLKDKWWSTKSVNMATGGGGSEADTSEPRCASQTGIGIDNIGGFCLLMLAGIGVAFFAVIGEFLFYRQKYKRESVPSDVVKATTEKTTIAPSLTRHILHAGQVATSVVGNEPRACSIGWADNLPETADDGGHDVAQALANIVKCRQRRRRLSRSMSVSEANNAVCWMTSYEA